MNTTIKNIELILTSEYSTKSYVEFVQNVFSSMRLIAHNNYRKEFSNFSSHIMGYTHIGEYITSDSKKVAIFSVELKNAQYVQNSRSTQRSYAKKLIEAGNCDAALVAFYTTGDVKWRISFVRLDYEMKIEHGKLKTSENITPAKRYSFLVGKDEPCHTAIDRFQQFIVSGVKHSLDELEEAFSVERVTKEFFELYCEKFYQLQEYLESNEDFVEESKRCGFTSEQFAKKLMGQIVFLYFLQKKGWLGVNVWPQSLTEKEYKNLFFVTGAQGRIIKEHLDKIYVPFEDGSYRLISRALDEIPDEDEEVIANHITQILVNGNDESRKKVKTWGAGSKKFLRTIFEFSQKHRGHFYENYLEPLFYNTLNKNRGNMGYCPFLHCRVPFLSGGLFDPLDGYDWRSNHFDIPDKIFSNKKDDNDRTADGILDIFDRYNFTMSEDEPLEREVAIDPEMLGKIFENLLEVRDRKSKGAFYTPREIVHYMCQESLVNYLVRKTGISEAALRDFILYGDFMKDEDTDPEKRKGNGGMYISEELFKVGEDGSIVVNRLIDVDKALATVRVADPAVGSGAFPLGMVNEIVRARQNITAYISIGMNANNKRLMYKNERSPYMLKYQAIRDSIFAVDIEPSAVDIAQLRLWLSLVIDDEVTPDAANDFEGHRNPLPLPNLECNIICGNSLVDEFEKAKLIEPSQIINSGNDEQISIYASSFETIILKLLKLQDELFVCDDPTKKIELKSKIQSLKDMIVQEKLSPECFDKYKTASQQTSKPCVLWQLEFARVFRDNGGFDIVIGNPPYFNVQSYGAKHPMVEILKRRYQEIWMDKSDILFYFIYLGYLLSADQVCYITSNAYLFSDKAKKFRNFIVTELPIKTIVNFENYMVFDSASITSCITTFQKKRNQGRICNARAKVLKNSELSLKDVLYKKDLFFDVSFGIDEHFALIPPAIKTLHNKIKGNNPLLGSIFKVGKGMETAANEVFLFDTQPPFPEEYIRRRVTGDIISRYAIGEATQYLLYHEMAEDFSDLDGSVQRHLEHHREFLENRATVKNEGRTWWRYSRPMHKEFYHLEKIWCSYRSSKNCFALDTVGDLIGFTNTTVIFNTNSDINFKYILALVNSKLLEYQHKNSAKATGGGIYEYFPNTIERYPIFVASEAEQNHIAELVDQILATKKANPYANTDSIESEIDSIIYGLYGLTEEEIAIVENAIG